MLPIEFKGPLLKIHRAETHISDLHNLFREFMKVQVYKAIADVELEPGNIVWIAKGERRYDHEELSPIIGDAIHNLRDSLDLAVSVIMRNAGLSDEHVMFPTAGSIEAFQEAISGGSKKPTFPPKLIAVLESRIEPYEGGNGYWLRTLHNLAIMDKHRLLVPTVFGLDSVHIPVEGGEMPMRFYEGVVPIEDGSQLARMPLPDWPSVKVEQEARVTLAIVFDRRSGHLAGWPIVEGLYRLKNVTEGALDALATCL